MSAEPRTDEGVDIGDFFANYPENTTALLAALVARLGGVAVISETEMEELENATIHGEFDPKTGITSLAITYEKEDVQ